MCGVCVRVFELCVCVCVCVCVFVCGWVGGCLWVCVGVWVNVLLKGSVTINTSDYKNPKIFIKSYLKIGINEIISKWTSGGCYRFWQGRGQFPTCPPGNLTEINKIIGTTTSGKMSFVTDWDKLIYFTMWLEIFDLTDNNLLIDKGMGDYHF